MNPLVYEERDFREGDSALNAKNAAQTKFDQWFNSLGAQEIVYGYQHIDGGWRYSSEMSDQDSVSATLLEKNPTNLREFPPEQIVEKYDRTGQVHYYTQDGTVEVKPLVFQEVKNGPKDSKG